MRAWNSMFGSGKSQILASKRAPGVVLIKYKKQSRNYLCIMEVGGTSDMKETASTGQRQHAYHHLFIPKLVNRHSPLRNFVNFHLFFSHKKMKTNTITILLFISFNDVNAKITCQ